MTSAQSHLRKFPHARSSTLAYLEKRQQTTEQLRRNSRNPSPAHGGLSGGSGDGESRILTEDETRGP